ncbi:hypothetical protein WR25_25062 [Diploscapter pachys]|uniref:Uncharacterized protein n=1 Tax=Diploscapter pachys TaxID=2018661 RepID=A0A2A2M5T0_9BILA|nr:hypothetical protein WR25_25062 [Diploscapter pachys]
MMSLNRRRERYSASTALSTVHTRIPARPLSRKRTRLPPCPVNSICPTRWPMCCTGMLIGSSSSPRATWVCNCAITPGVSRCQWASSSPSLS